jgi:hypothetical protein
LVTLPGQPTFLRNMLKEEFLDNTHRLTFIMSPQETFNQMLQGTLRQASGRVWRTQSSTSTF